MSERLSPLAEAIAKRERTLYPFDLDGFTGLGGRPIAAVKIRIATKGEQDRALCGAHAYVENLAKNASIDARVATEDRDILLDAKTCFILAEVCRDASDPKYPAFPGPRWMIDQLTTDEIGVLLNCYHEALRQAGTIDFDLSSDRLTALSQMLAKTADTDAPNQLLLRFTREQLAEICVRIALQLETLRAEEKRE